MAVSKPARDDRPLTAEPHLPHRQRFFVLHVLHEAQPRYSPRPARRSSRRLPHTLPPSPRCRGRSSNRWRWAPRRVRRRLLGNGREDAPPVAKFQRPFVVSTVLATSSQQPARPGQRATCRHQSRHITGHLQLIQNANAARCLAAVVGRTGAPRSRGQESDGARWPTSVSHPTPNTSAAVSPHPPRGHRLE